MTFAVATGACKCGLVHFEVKGRPLFRAYCHCSNCQSFNAADMADIPVVRRRDVTVHGRAQIASRTHQEPPLLKRGNCSECGGVAIEEMKIPLLPELIIIPLQTLNRANALPSPRFHMFYDRRNNDADDALPKHTGYLRSQIGFSATLLKSLMVRDNSSMKTPRPTLMLHAALVTLGCIRNSDATQQPTRVALDRRSLTAQNGPLSNFRRCTAASSEQTFLKTLE